MEKRFTLGLGLSRLPPDVKRLLYNYCTWDVSEYMESKPVVRGVSFKSNHIFCSIHLHDVLDLPRPPPENRSVGSDFCMCYGESAIWRVCQARYVSSSSRRCIIHPTLVLSAFELALVHTALPVSFYLEENTRAFSPLQWPTFGYQFMQPPADKEDSFSITMPPYKDSDKESNVIRYNDGADVTRSTLYGFNEGLPTRLGELDSSLTSGSYKWLNATGTDTFTVAAKAVLGEELHSPPQRSPNQWRQATKALKRMGKTKKH